GRDARRDPTGTPPTRQTPSPRLGSRLDRRSDSTIHRRLASQTNTARDHSKLPERGVAHAIPVHFAVMTRRISSWSSCLARAENNPKSFFWNSLVGVIYNAAVAVGQDDLLVGITEMIGSKARYRKEGKFFVFQDSNEIKTEQDRIEVFDSLFDIKYPPEAAANIQNKDVPLVLR
ncbi:hypothetical protein FS837_008373, partial [Tulasnella sp. UAMH 9824]